MEEKFNRSSNLIAEFEDGFARNWFMAVGEWLKEDLDIRYTSRIIDGKLTWVWTQGPCFSFSRPQIIYDISEVYLAKTWAEALHHLRFYLQIIDSAPNRIEGTELIEGFVRFNLFLPDESRTKTELEGTYRLTQSEFVRFLKSGDLPEKHPLEFIRCASGRGEDDCLSAGR